MAGIDHAQLRQRFYERQLELLVPADLDLLRSLPIMQGLPEKTRTDDKIFAEKIAKYTSVVDYDPGDLILELGAYNDTGFYILEGAVEVKLPREGQLPPPPKVRSGAHLAVGRGAGGKSLSRGMLGRGVGTSGTVMLEALPPQAVSSGRRLLEAGDIFGEMSAISRYTVSATVTAATKVKLLRIQLRGLDNMRKFSKDFKAFMDTRYRERALGSYLKQVELFNDVDDATIAVLTEKAELVSFPAGKVIVAEGTPADAFYLVRGGYVKVCVRQGASDLAVTYLRKGDYAGASALLLEVNWPFTLQALESVEMVKLGREEIGRVIDRYPAVVDEMWRENVQRLKDRGAVARNPMASEHMQMAMDTGLIHGESVLLIDLSTCTRCDECVRGCANAHDGEPRFVREGERYGDWLIPTACYQCTDPVCMIDCPTGAITREFGELVVTINPITHPTRPCIGCEGCARRCPWHNIVMVDRKVPEVKAEKQATKCDWCYTRPQGPACVQMCPHGSAVRIPFREMEQVIATLDRTGK